MNNNNNNNDNNDDNNHDNLIIIAIIMGTKLILIFYNSVYVFKRYIPIWVGRTTFSTPHTECWCRRK